MDFKRGRTSEEQEFHASRPGMNHRPACLRKNKGVGMRPGAVREDFVPL